MIVTRKCLSAVRTLPLRLLYPVKTGISRNELLNIYSNSLSCLSCRHCRFDALVSELAMNNPARTSTVILENYCVQVANYYKNSTYKLVKNFSKSNNGLWVCQVSIQWPVPNEFRAEESKKTEAARVASWLALEWLKSQNKIDQDGRPLLVSELNASANFSLQPGALEAITQVTQKYESEMKPLYEEYDRLYFDSNRRYFDDHDIPSYCNLTEEDKADRSDLLLSKLKEMPPKQALPIDSFSEEIVDIVEKNRVVVIKGATGSGKTTRVPQFLLDHYIRQLRGAECNIAVTQPRRISATSLATRIAAERNENAGFSVGHHIRFSVCYPTQPGTIMFVSTGILLQRLLLDPMLNDLSHVIIDEAHERDLNIDLLLLLMKELLEKNNKIRVVIMSATINAELFQQYFNNCPLISIPGFMHNVNTYFIDDDIMNQNFGQRHYEYDEREINDSLILNVVQWIHRTRAPGAVLVFLPGWSEISKIQKVLQDNSEMHVLTAHSKMKIEQQQLIFEPPPEGKRKVILATNIAETSITIPDVVYVVDSGIVREIGNYKGVKGLTNVWISKAIADQRRGRAGRVTEGECFRLYSRKKYESFDEYPVPEVLRVSLENLVMRTKAYTDDRLCNTLSKFPEQPPENAVREAIIYLQQINVLDLEENLTALGKRIAMFALHPLLSAALVYSVFFNCIDPMLFVTSNLNGDAFIFGIDSKSSSRRNVLSESHPTNDTLASYNIYNKWKHNDLLTPMNEEIMNLNIKAMENFKKVLRLNMDSLFKAHLVTVDVVMKYEEGTLDSVALDFVSPILLAATGRLAVNAKPYRANGKINHYLSTLDGLKVQIANDSVNFKNAQVSSPFLTFYNMNTTEEGFLRIYDTAQVSPTAALLFCPTLPQIFFADASDTVRVAYPNIELQITANREEVQALLRLREVMWSSVHFFITHHNSYVIEPEFIKEFKTHLLSVLGYVLKNCDS